MNSKIKLAFVLCIVLSLGSCIKEPTIKEYTPTVAIPLISTDLTVYDLLARVDTNDLIVADPQTNLLALEYTNSDLKLELASLFTLSDFSMDAPIRPGINQPVTPAGGQIPLVGSTTVDANVLPFDVYQMDFNALTLTLEANSSFQHEVDIEITLPNLVQNGKALNLNLSTAPNSSASTAANYNNSELNLEVNNNPNQLVVDYNITINTNGAPIESNDELILRFTFGNMDIGELTFDPGAVSFPLEEDSIALKIFRNTDQNQVEFELTDPELEINIENSMQVPFEINLDRLDLVEDGQSTELLGSFSKSIGIAAAPNENTPATRTVLINKDNSNIQDALTPNDKHVVFDLSSKVVTQGNDRFTIRKEDYIDINMAASLPLKGYVRNWQLSNVVSLGLNSDSLIVSNGGIKYHIESHFPANAQVQIYFLDADSTVTDSLFNDISNQEILKAGVTDASGKVISPTISNGLIDFSSEKLTALLNADFIDIRAVIGTAGSEGNNPKRIGIHLNDHIEVKLGVKAQFKNQIEE